MLVLGSTNIQTTELIQHYAIQTLTTKLRKVCVKMAGWGWGKGLRWTPETLVKQVDTGDKLVWKQMSKSQLRKLYKSQRLKFIFN